MYYIILIIILVLLIRALSKAFGNTEFNHDLEKAIHQLDSDNQEQIEQEKIKDISSIENVQVLDTVKQSFNEFNAVDFLDKAEQAFIMTLENFATENTATLAILTKGELLNNLTNKIKERQVQQLKQNLSVSKTKIQKVMNSTVNEQAVIIELFIESEVIAYFEDKEGKIVSGGLEARTRKDSVKFEKSFNSKLPNWHITAIQSL